MSEFAGLAVYLVEEDGTTKTTGQAIALHECPDCEAFVLEEKLQAHLMFHSAERATIDDKIDELREQLLDVIENRNVTLHIDEVH